MNLQEATKLFRSMSDGQLRDFVRQPGIKEKIDNVDILNRPEKHMNEVANLIMRKNLKHEIIEIKELDTKEAYDSYGKLMATFRQHLGLNEKDAVLAVSIAVGVCPYCYERPRGCQCWNDE